jgi:hypothetical protein
MCGVFEQASGISFERAAVCCGLSGEFRLNLGPDFNGNRHGVPFKVAVVFLRREYPILWPPPVSTLLLQHKVLVPHAVANELQQPNTPATIRAGIDSSGA